MLSRVALTLLGTRATSLVPARALSAAQRTMAVTQPVLWRATQYIERRSALLRQSRWFRDAVTSLEETANANPHDPAAQAALIKELVKTQPLRAIERVESGRYAVDERVYSYYTEALVQEGMLTRRKLTDLYRVASSSSVGAGAAAAAPSFGGALGRIQPIAGGAGAGAGAGIAGAAAASTAAGETRGFKDLVIYTAKMALTGVFIVFLFNFLFEDGGQGSRSPTGGGGGGGGGLGGLPRALGLGQEPEPVTTSKTKFSDVKGIQEAKDEMVEVVEYLRAPDQFSRLGGRLPKGILLTGPPGNGKTLLARAVAGEAGVPFFYASGSEFEEVFVGVGSRRIRELFKAARARAPCIIFIDEIDAIGGKRNGRELNYTRMTLNQLLVEMDGFKQTEGIIVIAATNFPEILDKALLRPGRFDKQIHVSLPDVRGRKEILELYAKNVSVAKEVDLDVVARTTVGFTGADLENLMNQAAVRASVRKAPQVEMEDIEHAKDRILMGAERKSAVISEANRRLTAFHESGHAITALYTTGAMPIHKATIMPRGQALGMVMQLPDRDQTSITRQQLLARLDVCMGGRVAEELVFGADNITTGASSDFQQATSIAQAMVMRYGMSDKVGVRVIESHEERTAQSPELRALVDMEVKRLLDESYARVSSLLRKHNKELTKLAEELLERETLTGNEVYTLLGMKAALE